MKTNKGGADDMFLRDWPHYPTDSDKRKDNLGQVMSYSTLVFDRQHRTHHFTVVVIGSCARLIYWDRSVAVFTEKFDYKAEPHKLGRFLWCFSRMTPAQRGHDTTVTRVLRDSDEYKLMRRRADVPRKVNDCIVDEHAREGFEKSLDENWHWYKTTVHDEAGDKEFLIAKPNFIAAGLAGRGTRGYIAIDMADKEGPFVYLKDSWRVVHDRIQKEGDILSDLNKHKIPYIPTLRCHGDVPNQKTDMVEAWKSKYGKLRNTPGECPLKVHQHYRMVVNEVGLPLSEFKNGKQLVLILLDCLIAHKAAFEVGYLHRDISAGNILIYPKNDGTGKVDGMLTDWELAKRVEDDSKDARQPDRTGTWQFTSALALDDPRKAITIPDELESMLHVLLYNAFHYLPSNCIDLSEFVASFFDDAQQASDHFVCGEMKYNTMELGKLRMKGH
ncbi:hypothetical protein C8Q76DRAFT_660513, partial [Earliella scabrosa]